MFNDKAFNYLFLRQTLGGLGIALPFLVILAGLLGDNHPQWWWSISATYYTNAGTIFSLVMGAVAFFLFSYRMYSKLDWYVNKLAGVFALLIILFPCYTVHYTHVGVFNVPIEISSRIHNTSAVIFFCLLAFNIFFLFTRGSGNPTPEKKKRNRFYRICGIGILIFMTSQVFFYMSAISGPYTMINEAGMLICFGIAWLVKGQAILKDKRET